MRRAARHAPCACVAAVLPVSALDLTALRCAALRCSSIGAAAFARVVHSQARQARAAMETSARSSTRSHVSSRSDRRPCDRSADRAARADGSFGRHWLGANRRTMSTFGTLAEWDLLRLGQRTFRHRYAVHCGETSREKCRCTAQREPVGAHSGRPAVLRAAKPELQVGLGQRAQCQRRESWHCGLGRPRFNNSTLAGHRRACCRCVKPKPNQPPYSHQHQRRRILL